MVNCKNHIQRIIHIRLSLIESGSSDPLYSSQQERKEQLKSLFDLNSQIEKLKKEIADSFKK